jgi:hypothetical protein
MALKLFLETLELQGQLSSRPPEIIPLQFVGVFGQPFSELR